MSERKRPPGAPPCPQPAEPLVNVANDDDDFLPAAPKQRSRPPPKTPPSRVANGAVRRGPGAGPPPAGRGTGPGKAAVRPGCGDENTASQEAPECPVCGLSLGLWPTLQARAFHVDACLARHAGGERRVAPPPAVAAAAPELEPQGPSVGAVTEAARDVAAAVPATHRDVAAGELVSCGDQEEDVIDLCGEDGDTIKSDRGHTAASPPDAPGMTPVAPWRSIPRPVGGAGGGCSSWPSPGAWLGEHGLPPGMALALRSADISVAELPLVTGAMSVHVSVSAPAGLVTSVLPFQHTDDDLRSIGITELECRRRLLAKAAQALPPPPLLRITRHLGAHGAALTDRPPPSAAAAAAHEALTARGAASNADAAVPADWVAPSVPPLPPVSLISRGGKQPAHGTPQGRAPPPVQCCEAAALAAVAATSWAGGVPAACADEVFHPTPPLLPSAAADAHGAQAAAETVWLAHQAPAVAPAG